MVTVRGNTDLMFFGDNLSLVAEIDSDSSKDGLDIQSCCKWLGISVNCTERIISALGQGKLQLDDDPENAVVVHEQVNPKDFDCSEASLESESEYYDLQESFDDLRAA